MFGRRQKRVEDEPLVPHGLVGQATEDSEQTSRSRGEVIPFPSVIAAIPDVNRLGETQSTKTAPLHSSLLTHVEPLSAPPASPTIPLQATAINSVQMIASKIPNESIAGPASVAIGAEGLPVLQRFLQEARDSVMSNTAIVCRLVVARRGELGRAARIFSLEKFRLPASNWLHRAADRLNLFRERATSSMAKAQLRIQPWLRGQTGALLHSYRRATTKEVRVRLRWPSAPEWLKSVPSRVRIRRLESQRQVLFSRIRAEWILQRQHFGADSRAWAALAMGIVCALLALGFISVVRHYATAALPSQQNFRQSNAFPVNSEGTSKPLSTSKPVPGAAAKGNHSASPSIASGIDRIPVPVAKKPTARPRHRSSMDDDYVAKDTYVVYDQHTPSH